MKDDYWFQIITTAVLFGGIGFLSGYGYKMDSSPNFKVGDCLVISNDYIYKVLEVGKYGLKTVRPNYETYTEILLDSEDVKKSHKMDCFSLFDNYGPKKENE